MKNIIKKQSGVYVVEFAMISAVFMLTVLLVMEGIRYMYFMNAASEVTRRGARVAVVCGKDAAGIKDEMITRLPILSNADIVVEYNSPGLATNACDEANCQTVTVRLADNVTTTIMGITARIPRFATTLPRESMNSGYNTTICS